MDRRDAMARMRQELNEINPVSIVRSTSASLHEVRAPSIADVEAAAGPRRRSLTSDARRNLFVLTAFSLVVAVSHHWILGMLSSGADGWESWAAGFLSFPFAWAQPVVAGTGAVGLIGLALASQGFMSMTVNQARSATPLAWTAAIGSGALVIFGVVFVVVMLLLATLVLAFLVFMLYILIGMASG